MVFAAAQIVEVATQLSDKTGPTTLPYWVVIITLAIVVGVLAKTLHGRDADDRKARKEERDALAAVHAAERTSLTDENASLRASLKASHAERLEDAREIIPLVKETMKELLRASEAQRDSSRALEDLIARLGRANQSLETIIEERISNNPGDTPPVGQRARRGGERR